MLFLLQSKKRFVLVAILCFFTKVSGIQIKPALEYGPPNSAVNIQRVPHRQYGVPQKIPFREYGPPALKYGPPKLIGLNGGLGGGKNIFHDQIKTYFGVPKAFYGPPHSHTQYKPAAIYGPPVQLAVHYNVPKPADSYGPPPALQKVVVSASSHKPATFYGPPPKSTYSLPHQSQPTFIPQALPLTQPAIHFKEHPEHQKHQEHHPATSYGPPASGPLNYTPKQIYGPPADNYGPPPLPNFNGVGPEDGSVTVITGTHQHHQQPPQFPSKQIHIDATGHTHSITGSQAPFHTACDGWKPIPGPSNGLHDSTIQTSYSHVTSDLNTNNDSELSEEQIVALALQSNQENNQQNVEFHTNNLNLLDSNVLQDLELKAEDTYSRPPLDSFAPGSVHAIKYQINDKHNIKTNFVQPSPVYGPAALPPFQPPPTPSSNYLPPLPPQGLPQVQYHHHLQSGLGIQYGKQSGNVHGFSHLKVPAPSKPVAFRPPVPQGLIESIGATVQHLDKFGVKPAVQVPTYIPPAANEIAQTIGSGKLGNLEVEYGVPMPPSFPPQEHTYIQQQQLPLLTSGQEYNFFLQPQQHQYQQQQQQQQHYQQLGNLHNQYGPPTSVEAASSSTSVFVEPLTAPTQQQLLTPPESTFLPPPLPLQAPSSVLLLPTKTYDNFKQNRGETAAYTSSATATFENAYSASEQNNDITDFHLNVRSQPRNQQNQQDLHHQHIQQQQQQQQQYQHQFNLHDCGNGPKLLGAKNVENSENTISQSIPVAEQHSQYYLAPSNTYGPPSDNNIDTVAHSSQSTLNGVLPPDSNQFLMESLPGLDGLDIVSAQKSQNVEIMASTKKEQHEQQENNNKQQEKTPQNYQQTHYHLETSTNKEENSLATDHDNIISSDLLQTILTAIEQPQKYILPPKPQSYPINHKLDKTEAEQTNLVQESTVSSSSSSSPIKNNTSFNEEKLETIVVGEVSSSENNH